MKEKKKLYRLENDYLVAGVCGGLGEYFEIEATLIRIIFVLLALSGSGILIYLFLWLIIPKKGEIMKIKKEESKKIDSPVKDKIECCSKKGSFFGLLLIAIGAITLLDKIMPMVINWDYVIPGLFIFLGFYLVLRK